MSDPGAGNSSMTEQSRLAYANLPTVLPSISCSSQSNSFLSSPLRHAQIHGKKVKFSPRQKMFAICPTDDSDSEQCLVYENKTQDDSFCNITPENSATPTEESITPLLLTPIRSTPTTEQEKGATLAAHGSGLALTLPKWKLLSKLFRRRTCPRDDSDSERCLVHKNETQDDSFCSITPENSAIPTDNNEESITPIPLKPIRSAPTTKQEKGATLAAHGSGLALTLPKWKLLSKLFRRRTTSSISDIDDCHADVDSAETSKVFKKKKLYQLDPKMIASQLTLHDAQMLIKIKPEELKGRAWVGEDKETRAPNVMNILKEFNRISLIVQTEILEGKTPSARAKVIVCYIKIADECRNIGNYHSLTAFLTGLQSRSICRLKKTWKEVSGRRKKKFEQLSHLMSEEDNWKVYKIELHETLAKGACVPFLGQFLMQILQLETVKEVITHQQKSQGRRPQSSELSADSLEILSAPTSPVNSEHNDVLNISEIMSPTDLDMSFDEQKNPTPSDVQPDAVSNQETKPEVVVKEDDIKHETAQEKEEGIEKEPSSTSMLERRDALSPLPIGKLSFRQKIKQNIKNLFLTS